MADVQFRVNDDGSKRWDVRYRGKDRRQHKRTFDRKSDAQRYAKAVETDLLRGEWIDPSRGRESFARWADMWMATLGTRKPRTRESYESIVRKHLVPRFGAAPIAAIDYPMVTAFIGELHDSGVGAGTVRNIRDVLRLILVFAVRSGALKANPVVEVQVARSRPTEMVFLEPAEIVTLAQHVSTPPARYRSGERRRDGYPEYGLMVRFVAYTGLRAGEMVALRRESLDLRRRRVDVNASASEAHGSLQIVATKTYERRAVPIPKSLIAELDAHMAGLGNDEFVWRSPNGEAFRYSNWFKRHFKPAVHRAGLPARTRFHDLRHTYAAMLIAHGAHPRAIMERMGHSTITVTLDTYGHLFPLIDEQLDAALDGTYRTSSFGGEP